MSDNATYYPVNLPSRCLVYAGIDKGNASDQIQIRTFKGKDEKLIAEISDTNFEKKFYTILKGVLKGIDPSKLTTGDRQYLMFWEAINSYSKEFVVTYECEHCWQKSDYTVDLSSLETTFLPENYVEPYEVKLPVSGGLVKLKLLRVEDMLKVDELDKLGQNVWLYRYALSIVNDKSVWDNVSYLEAMESKDISIIRAFHEKFVHGIKAETPYECPKCGGTGVMPVPFRFEMLLPFGKQLKQHIGDTI